MWAPVKWWGKVENTFLSNLPLHHPVGLVSVYCGYMGVLSNRRLKLGYRASASTGCISCCLESLSSSFPAKYVVFFRSQSQTSHPSSRMSAPMEVKAGLGWWSHAVPWWNKRLLTDWNVLLTRWWWNWMWNEFRYHDSSERYCRQLWVTPETHTDPFTAIATVPSNFGAMDESGFFNFRRIYTTSIPSFWKIN